MSRRKNHHKKRLTKAQRRRETLEGIERREYL